MQAYKLGEMLRKRFDNFLGADYNSSEVYSFSSYYDRTKESLQLVLASLFQPNQKLKWNSEINWLPIAFNTNTKKLDVLFHMHYCKQ